MRNGLRRDLHLLCSVRHSMLLSLAIALPIAFLFATEAMGQNTAAGIQPFSTQVTDRYTSLDLASSAMTIAIPLRSKTGKFPFAVNLLSNANLYIYTNGSTNSWVINNALFPSPFAANLGTSSPFPGGKNYGSCGTHSSDYELNAFSVVDETGASHPVPITIDQYGCIRLSQTALASDDSGYTISASYNNLVLVSNLWDKSGNQLSKTTGSYSYGYTVTDPDGVTGAESSVWSATNPTQNLTFTDTLNQTVFSGGWTGGYQGQTDSYSYTDTNGDNQTVSVAYTGYFKTTNFGCSGIPDGGYPSTITYLPTIITLPTGKGQIQIYYEQTPNGNGYTYSSAYVTGRIAKITYPTGGYVSFTYSGGNNGINCSSQVVPTLTRKVNDGTNTYTWTYVNSNTSATSGNFTVTETDPAPHTTTYNFWGKYVTQKQVKGAAGAVLATTVTCYNNSFTSCPAPTVLPPIGITQTDVFNYPNNWSHASAVETKYNTSGTVAEAKVYDYGAATVNPPVAAPSGSPLQDTVITYGGGGGASCGPLSVYMYDHPCSITTTNSTGHEISGVSFTYNAGGHATQTSRWVSSTSSLGTSAVYESNGILASTTDVNNAITHYDQSGFSCNGMLSNGTTFPITGLATSQIWDSSCYGGVVTQSTDLNSQVTQYSHVDPFDRVTKITDPLLNATNISYTTTSSESALLFNSNASTVDVVSTSDGLGRPISTKTLTGPGSGSYDNLVTYGYGWNSTGPYTTKLLPGATTAYTTQLDSAGRVVSITDGGGATTSFTYSDNDVLRSGPANSSQTEYDGLGRIKSVCEVTTTLPGYGNCNPTQNTAAVGYLSTYQYNTPAANAVTITQNALGTTQQRVYYYDGIGRLVSETNPESGTKTYTYDTVGANYCAVNYSYTSNGDLVATADANGNHVCYWYDDLHRVTDVGNNNQSGTNYIKRFRYDSTANGILSPPSGATLSNLAGHLVEAFTSDQLGVEITDEWFSYSPRGELTDVYESTPHSGGYYHMSAAYWANGATETLTGIGTQQTYSFNVDGEGRPYSASQSSTTLVSSTAYNTASQPSVVTLEKGDTDNYTWDLNTGRMKNYTFTVGSTPKSMVGAVNWNTNGTLGSLGITDGFNSSGTQTCTYGYDDLARVSSASCGSSWSQSFAYDAFGNVTKSGSSAWMPGYDSATNHYTLSGATYDSDGNLTADTVHTYTWDVYGKLSTIDGTTTLTYDATGRLVEKAVSGVYSEIEYSPVGKVAVMNGTSQKQAYVPMPGGELLSPGPDTFWHTDWLGTVRLASSANNRTITFDRAFAPFGELYKTVTGGTTNPNFTGDTQDSAAGLLFDTPNRELHPGQGRWLSPDPAGVGALDFANPQSFNRYAYVENKPLTAADPSGLVISGPLLGIYQATGENLDTCDTGSLYSCVSDGLWGWLSSGIAANPGSNTSYTLDGLDVPAEIAKSALSSGAAAICPNNDCLNVQNQPTGWYKLVFTRDLVFNCYGTASNPTQNCLPSNWTQRFIAGPSDIPFDPGLQAAAVNGARQFYWDETHQEDIRIQQLSNSVSVPFTDLEEDCAGAAYAGVPLAVAGFTPVAEFFDIAEGAGSWALSGTGVGMSVLGVTCSW